MSEVEFIAAIRHLCWCCYQMGADQPFNIPATQEQRDSLVQGVEFLLSHPESTPKANHDNWAWQKIRQGWTYGPVKDTKVKQHPDLVPFEQLPPVEQRKDSMDLLAQRTAESLYAMICRDQ